MNFLTSAMRSVALTAMLLGGCSPKSTGGQRGAEFRYVAKDIYSWLTNPSCSAPHGFDRSALLQGEMKTLADFGQEIAGTAAAQQLAIARQDVSFEQTADGRCWADDDIQFANIHVQKAKDALRTGLPKLRELSRGLQGREIDQLVEPRDQADFRYSVRKLIESTRPMCQLGTGNRDEQILAPARKAVDEFRQTLIGGPFAHQFEIAEADVVYFQSITVAECAEPSGELTEKLSAQALENVRSELSAVQKTMN